jgi:DNA topoisomerase topB
VDNEELRDALKENGIGRPSTRAAIIQTLFRRGYIRRRNKSLEATPTGVELIGVIKEELLKSAELTGQWENKLRRIEHHDYSASQFIAELKQMVCELVDTVLRDTDARRVTASASAELPAKLAAKQGTNVSSATSSPSAEKPKRKVIRAGSTCPQCGEGKVIKGNTAYGCSRWKEGCNWRKPFKK